jgi:hypothetical protein
MAASGNGAITFLLHAVRRWRTVPEQNVGSGRMRRACAAWIMMLALSGLVACATGTHKVISKEAATTRITEYVNKRFSGRKYVPEHMYRVEDRAPRLFPLMNPQDWTSVRFISGRWVAARGPKIMYAYPEDGLCIRASVNQKGGDPRLDEAKWVPE